MNNDVLRKVMLHMDKKTISALYPLTKNDTDCFIPILNKYGSRLNTLSIGRIVELLNKIIELEKYGLVLEYLDRISIDRMIRVLFKLVEKVDSERIRPLFNGLKKISSPDHADFKGRYEIIINHIENIINNKNKYRHCYYE